MKWMLPAGLLLFIAGLFYFVRAGPVGPSVKKEKNNPCGVVFPKPEGYTNDFIHLFTAAEKFQLDSIAGQHEKETSNQIAVITIDSAMLGACEVNQYTLEIAREWGVGIKGKNNGIVICLAPELRKIRIENGLGIQPLLTNAETQAIVDRIMVPHFIKLNILKA